MIAGNDRMTDVLHLTDQYCPGSENTIYGTVRSASTSTKKDFATEILPANAPGKTELWLCECGNTDRKAA